MSELPSNPYVGPRTFEEKDAPFFYGREREARDLFAFVISEPLVLFYAQSGAGKSSLINTSLIPNLRQEGFHALPVGRVGGNLPDAISDVRNIFTFNLLSNLDKEADPAQYTQSMLTDYLTKTHQNKNGAPRVLIVDQFEEILTSHPGRWQDREDFFWQLQAAMQNDPSLWVLLSMREDHIAALEPYADILPNGLRARFYMQRLKLEAAETAVEKPADKAGKSFDSGVAKELVRNLSLIREADKRNGRQRHGEYVEPVQLQVVCYQLWENLEGRSVKVITSKHVQELGNVDKALADFYNTAVADVVQESQVSEIDLRNWFEQKLITEAHTRGTVYQGPETTEGLANEAVNRLADKFLLRAERRAGGVWYELVHDRFVDPILLANARWLDEKGLLVRAAIAWEESGRSPSKLYLGDQLKDTLDNVDWRNMEPLVRDFLRECGRANQDMDAQNARRQKELEEAKVRAESEARNARRFWGLSIGLAIMSVLGIILLIISLRQWSSAAASRDTAEIQSTVAADLRKTAEASQANAQSQAATAFALATAAKFSEDSAAMSAAELQKFVGQETAAAVEADAAATKEQATAIAASTATAAAAVVDNGQVSATYLEAPPSIDGDLTEWQGFPSFGADHIVFLGSAWDRSMDVTSAWQIGWDNEYLYLAVEVEDDVHVQINEARDAYLGDSLEIQLDTDLTGDYSDSVNNDDFQYILSPGDFSTRQADSFSFQGNAQGRMVDNVASQVEIAARQTAAGYTLEAAIPWSELSVVPESNLAIGAAFSLNDLDTPGTAVQELMLSQVSSRLWGDPSSWGTLTLAP